MSAVAIVASHNVFALPFLLKEAGQQQQASGLGLRIQDGPVLARPLGCGGSKDGEGPQPPQASGSWSAKRDDKVPTKIKLAKCPTLPTDLSIWLQLPGLLIVRIYFNMKSTGKINISMKDKETCGFFSDYPYFCVTKHPGSEPGVLFGQCQKENEQLVCFIWGEKGKQRRHSFEPNFTSFVTDSEHCAAGRNPRISHPVCKSLSCGNSPEL